MPWKNEPELNRPQIDDENTPELSDDVIQPEQHHTQNQHANTKGLNIPGSTIESTIQELIKELKRRRRWGFALKLIGWLIIVGLIGSLFTGQHKQIASDHTALVKLEGVIADGYDASASNVLSGLRAAFEAENAKGVILSINSPGGSPVQADMLYHEIQRLKTRYNKPMVSVIGDIGASGGYYAAVAAEKIYANPSSIVGSIGVLMNGFGFVDLIDKIGVERRLLTAGENKGALDPFSPINEAEQAHAQQVMDGVHQQFIDVVRASRGERLKDDDELFSGQFWNGQQAFKLGLTDGFKNYWDVAREDIGEEKIVDYTLQPDVFERVSKTIGVSIAKHLKLTLGDAVPEFR